ncbi:hypothetical protein [Flavobacterium sp.]|uniref:hypothetical protein n=1 Tax=Flavobacterium sp. TaxID=239 RepID=UPI0037534C42
MGISELKNKIHQQIENSDEKILIQIAKLLETNAIISYDLHGNALNLEQYNNLIDKGIEDIKNGNFISQEDLEKEIQSWYNV